MTAEIKTELEVLFEKFPWVIDDLVQIEPKSYIQPHNGKITKEEYIGTMDEVDKIIYTRMKQVEQKIAGKTKSEQTSQHTATTQAYVVEKKMLMEILLQRAENKYGVNRYFFRRNWLIVSRGKIQKHSKYKAKVYPDLSGLRCDPFEL